MMVENVIVLVNAEGKMMLLLALIILMLCINEVRRGPPLICSRSGPSLLVGTEVVFLEMRSAAPPLVALAQAAATAASAPDDPRPPFFPVFCFPVSCWPSLPDVAL